MCLTHASQKWPGIIHDGSLRTPSATFEESSSENERLSKQGKKTQNKTKLCLFIHYSGRNRWLHCYPVIFILLPADTRAHENSLIRRAICFKAEPKSPAAVRKQPHHTLSQLCIGRPVDSFSLIREQRVISCDTTLLNLSCLRVILLIFRNKKRLFE